MKKDESGEWTVMKNKEGKRVFDQEENKEIIASHLAVFTPRDRGFWFLF